MNFNLLNVVYIGLLKKCDNNKNHSDYDNSDDNNGFVEITDGEIDTNYHRVEMTNIDWFRLPELKTHMINAAAIMFPEAKSDWGIITNFGLFTAVEKGELLAIGELRDKCICEIKKNQSICFWPGQMIIELDCLNDVKLNGNNGNGNNKEK